MEQRFDQVETRQVRRLRRTGTVWILVLAGLTLTALAGLLAVLCLAGIVASLGTSYEQPSNRGQSVVALAVAFVGSTYLTATGLVLLRVVKRARAQMPSKRTGLASIGLLISAAALTWNLLGPRIGLLACLIAIALACAVGEALRPPGIEAPP